MDHHILLLSQFEHFTGTGSQNWQQWVRRFEAKTSALPAADRLPCLISVLQGGALDFYASLPEGTRTDYGAVTNALADRFSQLRNPLRAQVELARACQQPGETVSDFADRLRQLGRLAHPQATPDDPTLDASLRGLFICGLRDAGLKSVLCNKNPESMDTAVRIAREFQCQQTALVAMQHFATAAGAHEELAPQVVMASSGGSGVQPATALLSLERRVDDIQQTLQRLCTDGLRRQSTDLAEDGGASSRGGVALVSGDRRRPPLRCFDCGDSGHTRRFCPKRRGSAGSRQCFACGGIGHLFRDCPKTGTAGRPFCLRCRRDGHWMSDCSHGPAMMSGVPACPGAGQTPNQGN